MNAVNDIIRKKRIRNRKKVKMVDDNCNKIINL